MLDLLQHRVGHAVGEDIAREEQHRQPVRMGEPAAVTMFVAPGPIEDRATMICRRRLALA